MILTPLDGSGKIHPVMIWKGQDAQEVHMNWGFRPLEDRPITLLRVERWEVINPCLIPMTEFGLKPGGGNLKYAASLITDEAFFCVAGMWRPGRNDWPASFAALTVPIRT